PGEKRVSRSGKSCQVRRLRTDDQCSSCFLRQAEKVDQPCERDFLQIRPYGRELEQTGVLVPCVREPVSCDRHRQRPADDASEEATPHYSHRRGRSCTVEQIENGFWIAP